MEKVLKMKILVNELNKASEAYYNTGDTIMSDKEFDSKLSILERLEKETGTVISNSPTHRVGATVLTKLDKVRHEFKPMLSLEKVHSAEEILKFSNGRELIATIKLDGLSVRLTYKYGELTKAETRGDGVTGSDITEHVKQFDNVPLFIRNKEPIYIVDGEAIITNEDFEAINAALPEGTDKFKNSRNLASGTLSLLDTSLVKERHLKFILWDVIKGDNSSNFFDRIINAQELEFDVVPAFKQPQMNKLDNGNIDATNDCLFKLSKKVGYPNDGIVWKFNDITYGESLGQTSHHFCNAVAFKPKDDVYETTLRDIEYTMGRTGILTPTAVFDPVDIDGTTVSRASVHNISILTDLALMVGDTIEVYKANQIIPQVKRNISAEERDSSGGVTVMSFPTTCPVCGGETIIKQDNDTEVLVCTNDNCKGKLLGKLSHFVSKQAMNIDGLSEATLEKFIELGWLNNFTDIYELHTHKAEMQKLEGFGKKSVDKLLKSIEDSRHTDLAHYLNAIGINGCGRSTSKDIADYCNGDIETFYGIMNNNADEFMKKINGIGKTLINSLNYWYYDELDNMRTHGLAEDYLIFNIPEEYMRDSEVNIDLSGNTYVITGSLEHFSNRDELKDLIESFGGKVSGSVSAKTTALINNDATSNSSKNKKAKELGVQIITEKEFLDIFGF